MRKLQFFRYVKCEEGVALALNYLYTYPIFMSLDGRLVDHGDTVLGLFEE